MKNCSSIDCNNSWNRGFVDLLIRYFVDLGICRSVDFSVAPLNQITKLSERLYSSEMQKNVR